MFEGVAPPSSRTDEGGGSGSSGGGTKARKATAAAPPPLPAWSDAGCTFFAGGPIWALDWCPEEEEREEEEEDEQEEEGESRHRRRLRRLLAVSAHPPASATTAIGQRLSGPALVQLWSVPRYRAIVEEGSSGGKRGRGKRPKLATTTEALPAPELAFALAHSGCLARDLKWRPRGTSHSSDSTVGVLAAALGDGSLTLWSVPSEAAVRRSRKPEGKSSSPASSAHAPAAAAVVVDLAPLAVGSGCGLLSAVAWCPSTGSKRGRLGGVGVGGAGGDELATAGFDGSAVLWRVEAASDDDGGNCANSPAYPHPTPARLVPLLRTARDPGGPLRCLAFPPFPGVALSHATAAADTSSFSSPRLRAFATAGHSPDARLWDASDPGGGCLLARVPLAASRAWALSMAWLAVPLGLLVAQDGGRLLFLPLDASSGGGSVGSAEAAGKKRGGKKKRSGSDKSRQEGLSQDWCLCRVAGGAEARDDAVWGVSACPGTATLAAYCTGGGFVGTFDVLPTPAAREAARRLAVGASSSGKGGSGGSGGGGGGGNQAVVSGFVPASAVLSPSTGPSSSSSSSPSSVSAAAVALPLTSEMRALAARAERAAEAEAAAAQQRADAAAAGPGGGGAPGASQAADADADAAAAGEQEQGQNPPPPRPAYALRDARLSVNRLEFSQLDYSQNNSSKAAWSALAAGGDLGVVRVHELDVERVARGRV